jgi:hypothetical protein
MCGLVGVVNKYSNGMTKQQQEIFNALLFVDFMRGNDSTGVFAVHNDGDILLAKEASDPIRFMGTKEYTNIMDKTWSRGNALIGHNRKATRGNVNDENAHPFVVDDKIVLVHNGTMYGDHKKIADVEVDSHAIAHIIHEKQGDVEAALSSFNAAYALIWYDFEGKTLNFVRNNDRPLWWMESNDSYIWASEKCMLDFVTGKFNMTLKEKPTELPPDWHQQFYLERNTWGSKSSKLSLKKAPAVVPVVHQPQHSRRRHPYEEGGSSRGYHPGMQWPGMYEDMDDADDVPFRDPVGATRPENRVALLNAPKVSNTEEFERSLAQKMGKIVSLAEWQDQITSFYEEGKRVTAQAFDYCYANQSDANGGFYIYLHLLEDNDIIIRLYMEQRFTTEERVVQISASEYIYNLEIGRKRWAPIGGGSISADRQQAGYCIIEGARPVLIEGGGMTNHNYTGATH